MLSIKIVKFPNKLFGYVYISASPRVISANSPKAVSKPFTNSKVCHLRAASKVLNSKFKHVGTSSSPCAISVSLDNFSHHGAWGEADKQEGHAPAGETTAEMRTGKFSSWPIILRPSIIKL